MGSRTRRWVYYKKGKSNTTRTGWDHVGYNPTHTFANPNRYLNNDTEMEVKVNEFYYFPFFSSNPLRSFFVIGNIYIFN